MPTDVIRYDLLVQDALRGVVRKVLTDAAREGMPGEHHFYVTFRTATPGVRLSTRMRERYPVDMTIVLQHQFWDLVVTDYALEVGLSFNNIPERLLVPFESITGFFDPSVQFGLKFEVQDLEPEEGANDLEPTAESAVTDFPVVGGKDATKKSSDKSVEKLKTPPRPAPAETAAEEGKPSDAKAAKSSDESAPAPETESAKVVSIDAFRKKT